ncbi:hypothetical protein GCM10007877_07910 [Marinibactrum halimedae]|uniref:Phosphoribosyltransferase domain-containing protein n=2 Tax=Marinibactrum halimedae TaxID=1444977 RepID=A0AA37T9B3_9GAMM|nr:hypothetical protein GCM10007877_07910 [Marinibactrum halimedae]
MNLKNTFTISEKFLHRCKGKNIALVDDVMTTGATVEMASQALKAAGIKNVTVWAIARTPETSC